MLPLPGLVNVVPFWLWYAFLKARIRIVEPKKELLWKVQIDPRACLFWLKQPGPMKPIFLSPFIPGLDVDSDPSSNRSRGKQQPQAPLIHLTGCVMKLHQWLSIARRQALYSPRDILQACIDGVSKKASLPKCLNGQWTHSTSYSVLITRLVIAPEYRPALRELHACCRRTYQQTRLDHASESCL